MNWMITGVMPAAWRVFDDNGIVYAQGVAISRKRARRAIREYLELARCV